MSLNVEIFYMINHGLQNPIFDFLMPIISPFGGFMNLLVICLILLGYAKLKGKDTLFQITLIAFISLLIADFLAIIFKHVCNQPRPYVIFHDARLLIGENDPFGFPSGHATSTVAVVSVFIYHMKKLFKKYYLLVDILLLAFAFIIPFSRIYVGVHFPLDVVAGAAIGFLCALFVEHFKDDIVKYF